MIGTHPILLSLNTEKPIQGPALISSIFLLWSCRKLLGVVFIAFLGYRLVKVRQEAGDEIKLIDLKTICLKSE